MCCLFIFICQGVSRKKTCPGVRAPAEKSGKGGSSSRLPSERGHLAVSMGRGGVSFQNFLKINNFLLKERLLGMGWVMCTTRRCSFSRRSSSWGSTSAPSASHTLPATTLQRSVLYLDMARMGQGCIRQPCIPHR